MTLYHFLAAHMVEAVKRDGLTMGIFPIFDGADLTIIKNCQWLTADKNPNNQSWATSVTLPYSRTAYRLTVNIPFSRRKKLVKASDFVERLPETARELVDAWEGSDQWYVYLGPIPAKWIVGCKKQSEQ